MRGEHILDAIICIVLAVESIVLFSPVRIR